MPVTVIVNNLSLCHKGSNGISTATVPDVCKTPSPGGPVPVPYPNISMSSDLSGGTTTVKADGCMIAVKGCNFMMSTGDEAGSAGGGVKSSKIKGKSEFILSSFDVKLDGKNACRLTDKKTQNDANTVDLAGIVQVTLPPGQPVVNYLKEIAKKCHQKVQRHKTQKKASCTVRGTHKHKCCEESIKAEQAKTPSRIPANYKPEHRVTKSGQSSRLDVAVVTNGKVTRIYDFKFNCKGPPKMSKRQRRKYKKQFGVEPTLIGAR